MQAAQKTIQNGSIHWLPLIRSYYNAWYFPDTLQGEIYDQLISILSQRKVLCLWREERLYSVFFRGENILRSLENNGDNQFALNNKFKASKLLWEARYYLARHGCQYPELELCVYNQEKGRWTAIPPLLIPPRTGYDRCLFLGDTALEERACI